MSLLSNTVSVTRYRVEGKLNGPTMEAVTAGLKRYSIREIDNEPVDKIVGWTNFDFPFNPNFSGSEFTFGTYFIFSLRIDKKRIPPKVLKKHVAMEINRRMKKNNRTQLSRAEKGEIKEHVLNVLSIRIPATPHVYDLLWDFEGRSLWFFTTQKNANEELETLFSKTFKLTLIRLFPYTLAELGMDLSDSQRDALNRLSPTIFTE